MSNNNLNNTYAIPNSLSQFGRRGVLESGKKIGNHNYNYNQNVSRQPIQYARTNHTLSELTPLPCLPNPIEASRFEPQAEVAIADQTDGSFVIDDSCFDSAHPHETIAPSASALPGYRHGNSIWDHHEQQQRGALALSSSIRNELSTPYPNFCETEPLERARNFKTKFVSEFEHQMQTLYGSDIQDLDAQEKAEKRTEFEANSADLDRQLAETQAIIRAKKEKIKVTKEQKSAIITQNDKQIKEIAVKCAKMKLLNQQLKVKSDEVKKQCNIMAGGPIKIAEITIKNDELGKAYCKEKKLIYSKDPKDQVQCDYWTCPVIVQMSHQEWCNLFYTTRKNS